MISDAQRATIRRLFFAEHWKVGTIAAELGLHHDAVHLAIDSRSFLAPALRARAELLDPYRDFIHVTLEKYPRLRATRLHEMLCDRGYKGSVFPVRRFVARTRPTKHEAFFRLSVMPGEQAQVDWASFGSIVVGRAKRGLSCFLMVLSWSRALFARFYLDQTTESFLRGHLDAFASFGGVPRTILYDNLKSAVLERGRARSVPPAHLGARWTLPLCAQALRRRARQREGTCRTPRPRSSRSLLCGALVPIARRPQCPARRLARARSARASRAGGSREAHCARRSRRGASAAAATARASRADRSRESSHVRKDALHSLRPKRLLDTSYACSQDRLRRGLGDARTHPRRHHRDRTASSLLRCGAAARRPAASRGAHRRQAQGARASRPQPTLRSLRRSQAFLAEIALHGGHLGGTTSRLLRLLDLYGAAALDAAIRDAHARGAFRAESVAHVLDQRRRAEGARPAITIALPDDPRVRDQVVHPHRLDAYDNLAARAGRKGADE